MRWQRPLPRSSTESNCRVASCLHCIDLNSLTCPFPHYLNFQTLISLRRNENDWLHGSTRQRQVALLHCFVPGSTLLAHQSTFASLLAHQRCGLLVPVPAFQWAR